MVSDTILSHANSDFTDEMDSHICLEVRYDNSYSRYDNQDYGYSQAYDDFLDERDDYDIMDV